METEQSGALATRAELYNVASVVCMLVFLAVVSSTGDNFWAHLYAMLCPLGTFLFFLMKARWLEHPYTRRKDA